jgi:hypothetical protein
MESDMFIGYLNYELQMKKKIVTCNNFIEQMK